MIKNKKEFEDVLSYPVAQAIEYTMDKILVEYKDIIEDVVYGAGSPNAILGYDRTYEFRDSWYTRTSKLEDGAVGELNQDISAMVYNPSMYQHGSLESGDIRDALAEIIYEGLSGNLFGDGYWREKRDAFRPLISKLDQGKLSEWFAEGMKKEGLTIRKRGVGRPKTFW